MNGPVMTVDSSKEVVWRAGEQNRSDILRYNVPNAADVLGGGRQFTAGKTKDAILFTVPIFSIETSYCLVLWAAESHWLLDFILKNYTSIVNLINKDHLF